MATPTTLKKLDDKKLAAQKRREQLQKDQLLPLSGMTGAPSAHLLSSGNLNSTPRMMDLLHPLSGTTKNPYMNYRETKGIPEEDFYSNRFSGLYNYTSSAQMNLGNQQMKSPLKTQSQKEKSTPAADTEETVSHTLRANNIVCFQGKEHFLSTLYSVNTIIDGHSYPSLEHYYQACKLYSLVGPEQAQFLRTVQNPLQAKKRAKDILYAYHVPNHQIYQWKKTDGLVVLLHGMCQKFNKCPDMRAKLLATGDALLCQAYDKDTLYAVGMTEQQLREWAIENDGKVVEFPAELTEHKLKDLPLIGNGKNVLGLLCMQVRAVIRDGETEEKENSNNSVEDKDNNNNNEEEEEDANANGEEEENVAVDDDEEGQALADEINTYLVLGHESPQGGNNKENKQQESIIGTSNNSAEDNNDDNEEEEYTYSEYCAINDMFEASSEYWW